MTKPEEVEGKKNNRNENVAFVLFWVTETKLTGLIQNK
jgi:hypothetical protein